jgi:dihydroceramidase
MSSTSGIWLPHSSSVDFCEPDYILTPYIAEPHNAWSSLLIALMGVLGILYSNPLKESMFTLLYLVIIAVGLGSVGLHTTLHWFPQSLDEVPMLWFNMVAFYVLYQLKSKPSNKVDNMMFIIAFVTILETYIYYAMRSLYPFFLGVYTLTTTIVVIWTFLLLLDKREGRMLRLLFFTGFGSFVVIGFTCWIIDMQLCSQLLPIYHQTYGLTLHVLWHIFAGYGGYMHTQTIIAGRARELNISLKYYWLFGFLPLLSVDKSR